MNKNGTNLAILGSTPKTTKPLIIEVDTNHQKIKFIRYLVPELEWVWSLRNVQR